MGPYSDKLNYQERWEVIHYIRSLQAGTKKLEYTATSNTFNKEAIPMSAVQVTTGKPATSVTDTSAMHGNSHAPGMNMNKH